jgi:hypothetical protein
MEERQDTPQLSIGVLTGQAERLIAVRFFENL